MGFDDGQKMQARQATGYQCVWCQRLGGSIEVHHIIPQRQGGPDALDNAVTLCPTCHADIGDNPVKRSQLKERRDWIQSIVAKNLGSPSALGQVHKIATMMELVDADPSKAGELREMVHRYVDYSLDHAIGNVSATVTASSIVVSASGMTFPPSPRCGACGSPLRGTEQFCPDCSTPLG